MRTPRIVLRSHFDFLDGIHLVPIESGTAIHKMVVLRGVNGYENDEDVYVLATHDSREVMSTLVGIDDCMLLRMTSSAMRGVVQGLYDLGVLNTEQYAEARKYLSDCADLDMRAMEDLVVEVSESFRALEGKTDSCKFLDLLKEEL